MNPPRDTELTAYLTTRLDEAELHISRLEAQREAHTKNFGGQIEAVTEKYMSSNGRLSDDAVELFGVCRKLMGELLNDSQLVGEAYGRRAELTAAIKRFAVASQES